jgi:hypothetical protein
MLRCMGAEYGAVLVDGGAEYVMLPRLPIEAPLPARASARAGESASARTVTAAMIVCLRRIGFRFSFEPA